MRGKIFEYKYFDLILFGSSTTLLFLGLLMIYSSTLNTPGNLLLKQSISAIIGFALMFVATFFDYRNLKRVTGILYLLILGALAFVLVFGENIRGSVRWIDLGFTTFQPSEFTKLIMVVVMAKFLDKEGEKLKSFKYVLISAFYVFLPLIMILIEPDLGSSLVLFFTWFAMLMFSRISKKQILILIVCAIILAVGVWFFGLEDYQHQRIFTFLNPNADPQGEGYNVIQSIVAVGSGGLFGRGVGRGYQSQLKFLPERQTDFIFASTAEELGLLGTSVILILYIFLLRRTIVIARNSRDNFGRYLSLGIFFMLFFQILVNIGMNIGLMPVTGIPLPLLSYGGTSLITVFLSLGLLQSVVAHKTALRFDR
jgi:rod shape determining protein RodA